MDTKQTKLNYANIFLGVSAAILVASLVYAFGGHSLQGAVTVNGCNAGYTKVNGQCVKNPPATGNNCNAGYTKINGQCVKNGITNPPPNNNPPPPTNNQGNCNAGYHRQGNTCVKN